MVAANPPPQITALEVRASDAILGVVPHAAFAPASLEEAAEVMTMAARDRLRLGFIGGGTALGLGAPPTALDAVIRSERLARIVEHAPADMVVIAEAGCTLATVQATVGAHGQRLALDAPWPEWATIGGLISTGAFGPLRARYGGVRDLIIGVTMVRADGEIARGGGKVVKNVAGFDLPKVACGALGTLGFIASAAFRLHPLPEATATVGGGALSPETIVRVIAAMRGAQLEPAAAVAVSRADRRGFDLGLRFEGFARGVADQVDKMVALARRHDAPAEPLDDAATAAFWRRHDAARSAAPLRVRVADQPSHFPAIAPALAALGDCVWYATLGVGFAGSSADHGAGAPIAASAVTAARDAIVQHGGALVLEAAPPELRAQVDAWGPVPPAFPIMQQLKRRFDPHARLNPGRFVGGL